MFTLIMLPRIANQTITYASMSFLENDDNYFYVPFKGFTVLELPLLGDSVKFFFNTSASQHIVYSVIKEYGLVTNQSQEFTFEKNDRS